MDPAFEVHMLTEKGKARAARIAESFDDLLAELRIICPPGRELALVVTKLEEASFFAKKAMAKENAIPPGGVELR